MRGLAEYVRQCDLASLVLPLIRVFEAHLSEYETLRTQPFFRRCRMVCDPRDDPDWGREGIKYKEDGVDRRLTKRCFVGCERPPDIPRVVLFIHRRVIQGIPVEEMRTLTRAFRETATRR